MYKILKKERLIVNSGEFGGLQTKYHHHTLIERMKGFGKARLNECVIELFQPQMGQFT